MMDADVCAQMSAGEPAISLAALAQLRSFLDTWLRDHSSGAGGVGAQTSVGPLSPATQSESESRWEAPE